MREDERLMERRRERYKKEKRKNQKKIEKKRTEKKSKRNLVGIKKRGFADESLDISHSSIGHVDGDFRDHSVLMLGLEFFDLLLLFRNDFGKSLLQALIGKEKKEMKS